MKSLDHYWYSKNRVAWILFPVSLFFCLLALGRRVLFRMHLLASHSLAKPVVIVGNISVGGTGKTPLIIELVKQLREWGYKPGIISRGYGGSANWPLELTTETTAQQAGDEPVQIFQQTRCPVVVGPDRVADGEILLQHHDVDLILADDGLQHYRLQRNCEIIVIDEKRRLGNGFCLPAGPLREPASRLKSTPWVIYNGGVNDYAFTMLIEKAVNLKTGESRALSDLSGSQIHAVAGIGHPQRFFNMLTEAGLNIREHAFADHHQFDKKDFDFAGNTDLVLMTQKDSVKCSAFAADNYWYVPLSIKISTPFLNDFRNKVRELCDG